MVYLYADHMPVGQEPNGSTNWDGSNFLHVLIAWLPDDFKGQLKMQGLENDGPNHMLDDSD